MRLLYSLTFASVGGGVNYKIIIIKKIFNCIAIENNFILFNYKNTGYGITYTANIHQMIEIVIVIERVDKKR